MSEIAFVLLHIAEEKAERSWILILFTLIVLLVGIESWCGLQKHRYTLLFPVRPRADPMILELLKIVLYKTFTRVGNIERLALFDFVEDDEVILVPVEDAWHVQTLHTVNTDSTTLAVENKLDGRLP